MKHTVSDYIHLLAGNIPIGIVALAPIISCLLATIGNSVRALCNASTSEEFDPTKDVSIPEINLPGGRMNGLIGSPSPSRRTILVFFAGGLHGPIRPILLEHWEHKDDEDVQFHSPRMVEALYTGCVPVIIKDHYVAPFSEVLNLKSFAVEIPVVEIPNLKKILTGISKR
ncbi:unnamed protein product [Fraxinus pennsylvanica]|uniref:Exostosin GT47 domain-containing protein n=1 Tax=Fraxinus pennsylvanica TaxID=56036 RepID=A0AAD2DVK5_9LAMI|nr:unnamed protein product [Fraxinus pennsylvanica]